MTVTDVKFVPTPGWERKVPIERAFSRLGPSMVDGARRMARVDTGEMRDSIDYKVLADSNPYGRALYLYVGAEHGIYNELGTRRMGPQPFLRPQITRRYR